MMETDNQHLTNTAVITASGRNHQGMSKWVGDEKQEIYIVPKNPPHKILINYEEKNSGFIDRKLADTT